MIVESWLTDISPRDRRGTVLSIYLAISLVGMALIALWTFYRYFVVERPVRTSRTVRCCREPVRLLMSNLELQQYGDIPLNIRASDHYQAEYAKSFVEKWDDLIDWRRRRESEGEFFIDVLRDHGAKKVLDVATGTGFHSVQLLKAGFQVTSVDGSPTMLAKAFENARDQGYILRTIKADWPQSL
jgi:hypothetical protein